jgi:DNA polymerase
VVGKAVRDELLELTRRFATHVAWQRELGALDFPRETPWPEPTLLAEAPLVSPASGVAPLPPEPPSVAPGPPPEAPPPPAPTVSAVQPQQAPFEAAPVRASEAGAAPQDEAGRRVALSVLADEIAGCHACGLAAKRTRTVPCRGNPMARLAFVGEGPGRDEDLQGLPFVGAAGQLLDRIILAMGLDRERDVWIANIVKCRPPNNRTPEPSEMTACTPFLVRQLAVTRPEVIVALGKTAASFLLGSRDAMGRLRGRWGTFQGVPVLPTWHPSYLLRQENSGDRNARRETWEDMQRVLQRLGLPIPSRGR